VIGKSKTGLSCVQTLVNIPFLYFSTIVIVSPDNSNEQLPLTSFFTNDDDYFDERDLYSFYARPNIMFFSDKLKNIDRKTQFITTEQNINVPYDYLVLSTSRQYKMPQLSKDMYSYNKMPTVS